MFFPTRNKGCNGAARSATALTAPPPRHPTFPPQAELSAQNAVLLEKRHEAERARLSQELQAARAAARAGAAAGAPAIPPGMTVVDEAAQAQMEAERKRSFLRMEKRVAHMTSQLASLTQKAARDAAQSAMRCVGPSALPQLLPRPSPPSQNPTKPTHPQPHAMFPFPPRNSRYEALEQKYREMSEVADARMDTIERLRNCATDPQTMIALGLEGLGLRNSAAQYAKMVGMPAIGEEKEGPPAVDFFTEMGWTAAAWMEQGEKDMAAALDLSLGTAALAVLGSLTAGGAMEGATKLLTAAGASGSAAAALPVPVPAAAAKYVRPSSGPLGPVGELPPFAFILPQGPSPLGH